MTDPIKIIDKRSWDEAVRGSSNNYIGDESIRGYADEEKLIVIDENDQ